MKQRQTSQTSKHRRRRVGIVVDGATGFGRSIMRGIMHYSNLQRQWVIYKELRAISALPYGTWPDCDGAILAGVGPDVVNAVRSAAKHIVRCSGSADPAESPVVCLDYVAVGVLAAEHLIDLRLQNFAFVGRERNALLSENRYHGFAATIERAGFKCLDPYVTWPDSASDHSPQQSVELVAWLRNLPKPVGIMAIDDGAADALAAVCLTADIAVPDEAAIIGVNNDDLFCNSAWPPLSSVDCDYSRVGYAAAHLLQRLFEGQRISDEERHIRLQPLRVVKRQSTELLAIDDPQVVQAVRYIREHACDPCTVDEVLQQVPVGRRWLERRFGQLLGRTPHDEIQRVRLEAAKRLLLQPELSLPQIAQRCGFATQQNLGRSFLKVNGQTPGSFRRAALRGSAATPFGNRQSD